MPAPNTSFQLVDISQVVKISQASAILGIAGTARWGEPIEIVYISNSDELVSQFLAPIDADQTPMHYQIIEYIKRGGTVAAKRVFGVGTLYGGADDAAAPGTLVAFSAGKTEIAVGTANTAFFTKYNGDFGKTIYVKISNSDTVAGTFTIELGTTVDGAAISVDSDYEKYDVSIDVDAKDGYGRSAYAPAVLDRESSLAAVVFKDNILPAEILSDTATPVELASSAYVEATASDIAAGYDLFLSTDSVKVDLIIPGSHEIEVQQKVLDVVELRGDCFGIVAPAVSETFTTAGMITYKTNLARAIWRALVIASIVKVKDTFNDQFLLVPACGAVAGAFAASWEGNPRYKPVAGGRRGQVAVQELDTKWSDAEKDLLYESGMNFLAVSAKYGITIEGNKTLYAIDSYLMMAHVANLIILIRNDLLRFLEQFKYEFNNNITRTLVKSGGDDYLSTIKDDGGLIDYYTVCDTSNNTPSVLDNQQLIYDVYLKPTPDAEYLILRAIIASSGVNLEELSI